MKAIHESYAEALYEVAQELGITDTVLGELESVASLLGDNPEYTSLLDSPTVQTAERIEMAEKAFGSVNEYLLNFLKILVENKCVSELGKVYESFSAMHDEKQGILRAVAVTAVALSDKQAQNIKSALEAKTGKTVILTNTVDASVIGGVRLDYGTEQIDKSVSSSLKAIGTLISDTDI